MYRCEFTPKALAALRKLARKNPQVRIPYLLDTANRHIVIDDVAQHDAAYDRINKLA